MISKGVIRITDEEKRYGRTYETCYSQDEYVMNALKGMLPGMTEKDLLTAVLDAFANKDGKTSKKTLNDIQKYIDESTHKNKRYYVYADGTSATIPQICNITATANRSTEAGYYARGGGQYEYGATVILQAFERDFIRWDDGNTDNPRTIIARGDATYTAIYTDN